MGTKYDLVTAAYGISYGKPVLYIWGRDADRNKKLFILKNERPHFYIKPEEVERAEKYPYCKIGETTKDIFGSVVVEIFTTIPKQVGELRRREVFSQTWEADIRFPLAMLIKRGIYGSFEVKDGVMIPCEPLFVPLKVCIIDLEVLSPPEEFPEPDEAKYPINSVAIWNTYTEEWHVFVFIEGCTPRVEFRIDENGEPTCYQLFATEKDLLYTLILYLEVEQFDVITGWNSNSFDMLTLYNRALKCGLQISKISPVGAVYKRSSFGSTTYMKARSEVYASGLILFDGLTAYKKVMVARGELESYSLAFVAEYELEEERIKVMQAELTLTKDLIKIGDYPKRDAYWTRRILDKRRVITYFDRIRKFTGCRLEDATINSRLLDSYCLHKAHDKGFVLPSKPKLPKDYKYKGKEAKFKGATVREPIVGRYRNIGVLDFSSHYPNAMIGCNMSPETIVHWYDVENPNIIVTTVPSELAERFKPTESDRPYTEIGNGVAFYSDVLGFVPELLIELKEERASYTVQMDVIAIEKGTTCDEWDVLYWLQFAVKFINTAFYGVFAYPAFRLFIIEISACTTFIGRAALQYAIEYCEQVLPEITGFIHVIIYGDTDSFFITLEINDVEYLVDIVERVNHILINLALEHNMVEGFQIKPERIFKSFILKDAKKKYFGEMTWKDGAYLDPEDPKRFQVKGFAARRSDSSRFTQKMQKELLVMIAEFKTKEEIIVMLEKAVNTILTVSPMIDNDTLLEFGVPKGFSTSKQLQKRNDPWARGARYAWIHYDKLILQHYKPKLLYVKFPGMYLSELDAPDKWWSPTNEVSFDVPEKLPKFLLNYIDHNTTIEKCILKKAVDLLEIVGIDWGEVGYGQTSLTRWS